MLHIKATGFVVAHCSKDGDGVVVWRDEVLIKVVQQSIHSTIAAPVGVVCNKMNLNEAAKEIAAAQHQKSVTP